MYLQLFLCLLLGVGYGSSSWQTPEQLRNGRETRAIDLFSLGCVLFFCFTGGQHPFGDSYERDVNIVNNQKDLFLVENIPEAIDLITRLLDPTPDLRYAIIPCHIIISYTNTPVHPHKQWRSHIRASGVN